MGVWQRLRRLVGMHADDALTRAEDPVKLVNYQVTQMQEGLAQAREEVAKAIAAERRLAMQAVDARRMVVGWQERARWAVKHGDDDMAREALERKAAAQEMVDYYGRAHLQQQQAATELRAALRRLGRLLQQAKARRAALLAHHQVAEAQQATAEATTRIVGEEGAGAFERLEERVELDSAEAAATAELATDATELRLAEAVEQDAIEQELHALKRELGFVGERPAPPALEEPEEAA